MSDEPPQVFEDSSAPTPETTGDSGATTGAGAAPQSAAATEAACSDTGQFWVRCAGWLVMCVGGIQVVSALHFSAVTDIPKLAVIGLMLMGGAYILAGQALSERYLWAIPLCVLSPLSYGGVLETIALGVLAFKLARPAADRGVLRAGITDQARTTAVLWLAGFTCVTLAFILSLG